MKLVKKAYGKRVEFKKSTSKWSLYCQTKVAFGCVRQKDAYQSIFTKILKETQTATKGLLLDLFDWRSACINVSQLEKQSRLGLKGPSPWLQ